MGKDKNAPKKPLTGFFRYTATIRTEVETETGLKGVKNARIFSTRWKALDEEKRIEFNSHFKIEMVDYRVKMDAYKLTDTYHKFKAQQAQKKYKKKAPKDKSAPKRALSAFFLFSRDNRERAKTEVGSNSVALIGKQMGLWWKAVTVEEKAKYAALNVKEKERYAAALEEYKKTEDYTNFQEKMDEYRHNKKEAMKKMKAEAKKAELAAQKEAAAAEAAEESSSGEESEDEEEEESN